MRLVLKNTKNLGDIEVTDGIITSIGAERSDCDEEIDCSNAMVWPGLIDGHVHFRTPGQEYKEDWRTGSAAALAGGVTSVQDMPNNAVPITTKELLEEKQAIVQKNAVVDFKLSMTASDQSVDELIEADPDFMKLYLGASTGDIAVTKPELLERIFQETHGQIMLHAEDEGIIRQNEETYKGESEPEIHSAIRGREAAIAAINDALELAKKYNRSIYLCHVSTKEELDLVRAAKKDGVQVYLEVTPHHLTFNEGSYKNFKNFVKVNPPLRTKEDNDALWQGIADGTVDVVATDHAPHTRDEKQEEYWNAPSGIPGIEFMFPLLLTGVYEQKITLDDIYRCLVENPAKIFGFTKNIKVGAPADLVVFEPDTAWVVQSTDVKSKIGWSPYIGYQMQGKVLRTIKHLS